MIKRKKSKVGKLHAKLINEKFFGMEPDLRVSPSRLNILEAYNWYSRSIDKDTAKEYLINYLKQKKFKFLAILKNTPSWEFSNIGATARMLDMTADLPSENISKFNQKIAELVVKYAKKPIENGSTVAVAKTSIQQKIKDKTSDLIASLEEEIDNFSNEGATEFIPGDFLSKYDVKPMIAIKIAEKYKPLYSELYDAVKGEDEDLNEAYRIYSKSKLKKFAEFVKSIISACETQSVVIKKVPRKSKKKKDKPAFKLVDKLKYAEKDDTYNLISVKPVDIIGAQQMWIFNKKTRMLGIYNATGPVGLTVSGSTIKNFDEKESISKKLRKPESILKEVLESGRITLRKIIGSINSKENVLTGRINGDTILLRIIK